MLNVMLTLSVHFIVCPLICENKITYFYLLNSNTVILYRFSYKIITCFAGNISWSQLLMQAIITKDINVY